MPGCAGFIVRYIAFVVVIGAAAWIAGQEWAALGIDGLLPDSSDPRAPAIALGRIAFYAVLFVGPILAAVLEGAIRRSGVFLAALLFGALVTAPFALARVLSI